MQIAERSVFMQMKRSPAHYEPGTFELYVAAGSVLTFDPNLCAVEGVGRADAQALIGHCKHTQTVVVRVAEAVGVMVSKFTPSSDTYRSKPRCALRK